MVRVKKCIKGTLVINAVQYVTALQLHYNQLYAASTGVRGPTWANCLCEQLVRTSLVRALTENYT
jgi:hypothetical protein